MKPLGQHVTTLFWKHGKTDYLQLLRAWPDIMGKLHRYTRMETFYPDKTLLIGVYDPQWMQELRCLSNEIVQHINDYFQKTIVTQVRCRLVARRRQKNSSYRPYVSRHEASQQLQLTSHAEQVLYQIPDQRLRQALDAFYRVRSDATTP